MLSNAAKFYKDRICKTIPKCNKYPTPSYNVDCMKFIRILTKPGMAERVVVAKTLDLACSYAILALTYEEC